MNNSRETHRFFDLNVDDYEQKHYKSNSRTFMTVRQERVLEFIDNVEMPPGAAVLDVGCGPGYLLEALGARGFVLSAVDASKEMLSRARERLQRFPNDQVADLRLGDIESLPFQDAVFDLVCSTGVIEYLAADEKALSEMYRVLNPGGYLLLPVTNRLSPINCLDPLVEKLKRATWFREPFNWIWQRQGRRPLLARRFKVRKHWPKQIARSLREAGFELGDDIYFYFLPWPRPFDRLAPKLSEKLSIKMERFGRSRLGVLGEGYLVLAKKG